MIPDLFNRVISQITHLWCHPGKMQSILSGIPSIGTRMLHEIPDKFYFVKFIRDLLDQVFEGACFGAGAAVEVAAERADSAVLN